MRFLALFVVSAKRTAFGTYGGALVNKSATELAAFASREALKAAAIAPEKVDHVVMGILL